MKNVLFLCLFVAAIYASPERSGVLSTQTAEASSQNDDEFVGPFSSWGNVKTRYGALGNGVADDTTALQNAFNEVGQSGKPSVMYLPAGSYRITATLKLAARLNVSIIGEHPATTSIIWDGSVGGTMLYLNGVAYSRFNRLTLDGKSKANVAIDQSKADGTSNYFDTGNEYADDIFTDVGFGIRGGALGHGFAETSVLRSQFIRNSQAGISLGNFNALDLFVWNSRFEDCAIGVTNAYGAGNFNVYSSIFKRSTFSDITIGNTGAFSFRNNYSIDSGMFVFAGATSNPATITLQGNTILDPRAREPLPNAIRIANLGPVFLLNNVIRSLATVTNQAVVDMGFDTSDLFSIDNVFTSTAPLRGVRGRSHSINDTTVTRASIIKPEPTLPSTPPNLNRQVFEVSPGSSTATIQAVINAAVAQNGSRPVVHLPPSTLSVSAPLVIPANTDLQMVGDGGASMIKWIGSGMGPVFRIEGPSKATLRDFAVNGNGAADGIVVKTVDQPGSRVFMEQVYLANGERNLFVNGLDYTNVQLQDFYHSGYGGNTKSVKVVGGPSAAAGTWLGGRTNIFSGASSSSLASYEALMGAHVAVRDIWYETNASSSGFIQLTGHSIFSFSGARIALPASTLPAIDIKDFTGKATFLGSIMDGNVVISGNGSQTKLLGIGLVGPSQSYFTDSSSPAAQALLLNSNTWKSTDSNSGASQIPEQGTYDPSFIRDMLSAIRTEQPSELTSLPTEVTDLRLYRVRVEQALTGIELKGGSSPNVAQVPAAPSNVFVAAAP